MFKCQFSHVIAAAIDGIRRRRSNIIFRYSVAFVCRFINIMRLQAAVRRIAAFLISAVKIGCHASATAALAIAAASRRYEFIQL